MKKIFKLLIILLLPVLLLTGCMRNQLVFENADAKITFDVLDEYKLIMDKQYFRTAREEAIIVDKDFKVGIELNHELSDKKITFDKFMEDYKKKDDFKKVNYSKMNGFLVYTGEYVRYEVYLKINDELILRLNIYSPNDDKKATTTALKSKDVQDILKHIKVEVR